MQFVFENYNMEETYAGSSTTRPKSIKVEKELTAIYIPECKSRS